MLLSDRAIWISDWRESTWNLAVIGCCLGLEVPVTLSLEQEEEEDELRRKIEAAFLVLLGDTNCFRTIGATYNNNKPDSETFSDYFSS